MLEDSISDKFEDSDILDLKLKLRLCLGRISRKWTSNFSIERDRLQRKDTGNMVKDYCQVYKFKVQLDLQTNYTDEL